MMPHAFKTIEVREALGRSQIKLTSTLETPASSSGSFSALQGFCNGEECCLVEHVTDHHAVSRGRDYRDGRNKQCLRFEKRSHD